MINTDVSSTAEPKIGAPPPDPAEGGAGISIAPTPSPVPDERPDIAGLRAEAKAEGERRKYKKRKSKPVAGVVTETGPEAKPLTPEQKEYMEIGAAVLDFSLDWANERMPRPKPITPWERDKWNLVSGALLKKYIPGIGEWTPEAGFITMAAMIFIPRAIDPTPKPKKDAPAPAFPEAPAELPAVEKVE